jgi:hypothetical protein
MLHDRARTVGRFLRGPLTKMKRLVYLSQDVEAINLEL